MNLTLFTLLFLFASDAYANNPPETMGGGRQDSKLKALRDLVLAKVPGASYLHNVTRDDDLYLEKWLKSSSGDVRLAADRFSQHLQWREKERIDSVGDFRWNSFGNDYVIITGHRDKQGRPVAEMWVTDWDLRKAIIIGERGHLTRWITRMVELQQRQLYESRLLGVNVTGAVLLISFDQFNFVTNGCPRCLQIYSYWGIDWDTHYPGLYESVIMTDVTPAISVVMRTLRSVVKTDTMNAIQQYSDKREWIPKIDAMIDPSQRSTKFGGNLRLY